MFWCLRPALVLLLLHLTAAYVFLDERAASQVLTRRRRANSFFEEVKKGNQERECVEERCSWEEAREIFENKERTDEFWAIYVDGDACKSNPCAHGGQCKDGIGSYTCYCQDGYKGFNCEIVIPELCENKNGGCEHFCNVDRGNVRCSCADGYFLASNDKSCESNEPFKCGAIVTSSVRTILRYERQNITDINTTEKNATKTNITKTMATETNTTDMNTTQLTANRNSTEERQEVQNLADQSSPATTRQIWSDDYITERFVVPQRRIDTRIVNGEDCLPGQCPWQALILNEDHQGFCGGTILNHYVILTAAHCMNQSRYIYVKLGEFDTLINEGTESVHQVDAIISHYNYKPVTYHNDIALIKLATPIKFSRYILPACIPEMDFTEKVLMRQPDGLVSGFGRLGEGRQASTILQRLAVPYVDRHTCIESTQLRITPRMFCAGYDTLAKDACQGDSGGPHVTRYRDTYFITGIVSWGEGCARKGKYGVYTQVSKYIRWIRDGINRLVQTEEGSRRKRRHGDITRLYL